MRKKAVTDVCAFLGLNDKTDTLTIMVAKRIIDLAGSGECDPERLTGPRASAQTERRLSAEDSPVLRSATIS